MNLKTKQLEAHLAKSTQQIQSLENIVQELTKKISNLVTNERVVKLELAVTQGETTTAELLTSLKKFDNKSNKIAKKIAQIQNLRNNIHHTNNLQAFSHLLALMIDSVLSSTIDNFENLMPTLKACRKIITDPEILEMVPDRLDIGRYFFHEMDDILDLGFGSWVNGL